MERGNTEGLNCRRAAGDFALLVLLVLVVIAVSGLRLRSICESGLGTSYSSVVSFFANKCEWCNAAYY